MAAAPPKPWKAEYAKSSCKNSIGMESGERCLLSCGFVVVNWLTLIVRMWTLLMTNMRSFTVIFLLSRNSEYYRFVEKYLMTTHSPTHKEWSLELEEVFSLERNGEKQINLHLIERNLESECFFGMYMDKPTDGSTTKGLGKLIPKESEYVKWRDQVTVPCGSSIASSIRSSELMYNEYIVYKTAQAKMQFLLKVRFHQKR